MKQAAFLFLMLLLLAVAALALARLSQLLAPHVGWPLIVLLSGGGLGAVALFLWQQQLLRSWPAFLFVTFCGGVMMALAGHFFEWRAVVAAAETHMAEESEKQPLFAALLEKQFQPPTWSEFMTPKSNTLQTIFWWIGDAAAKLGVALAVLIVGQRNGWFAQREAAGETA